MILPLPRVPHRLRQNDFLLRLHFRVLTIAGLSTHGFNRDARASYDAAAAMQGRERSLEFLKERLVEWPARDQ